MRIYLEDASPYEKYEILKVSTICMLQLYHYLVMHVGFKSTPYVRFYSTLKVDRSCELCRTVGIHKHI